MTATQTRTIPVGSIVELTEGHTTESPPKWAFTAGWQFRTLPPEEAIALANLIRGKAESMLKM